MKPIVAASMKQFLRNGALAVVVVATSGTQLSAQVFFWSRTAQDQETTSTVQITVRGVTTTQGPTSNLITTDDLVTASATQDASEVAEGGEGADGGSGVAGGNGFNGANGDNFTPVDGTDGLDLGTAGGKGGKKGANGEAAGEGSTVAINVINPDLQSSLTWSFIHNQVADLDLTGGAGGGGGGGGEGTAMFSGGNGGRGGDGRAAPGQIQITQDSTFDISADLTRQAGQTANPSFARFLVDIGWTSTASQTLTNTGNNPWDRSGTITMQHVNSGTTLTITGNGGTPLQASGMLPDFTFFSTWSTSNLNDTTGSLEVEFDDFEFPVALGDTVRIRTTANTPWRSRITGNMTANGGTGGAGAFGGSGMFAGMNGLDGMDGGLVTGPVGGAGGAGGNNDPLNAANGGSGGRGGGGQLLDAHEDGIFDGYIEVFVDQP